MHYSVSKVDGDGMAVLRSIFPDAEADDLNVCLFSTSGVHGTYTTIEDAEAHLLAPTDETDATVTFLVVNPRTVTLRYGNATATSSDDIAFLKKLRGTSHRELAQIGMPGQ